MKEGSTSTSILDNHLDILRNVRQSSPEDLYNLIWQANEFQENVRFSFTKEIIEPILANISYDQLTKTEGMPKGRSILWLLAFLSKNTDYISNVLEIFIFRIHVNDILVEDDDGKSLLFVLAENIEQNDAFINTWRRYGPQISIETIRRKNKVNGSNILIELAKGCENSSAIDFILKRFHSELTFNDMLEPDNDLNTVFDHLAGTTYFKFIWQKFSPEITIAHLHRRFLNSSKEPTNLWRIFYNLKDNVEMLSEIWNAIEDKITIEDLRTRPQDDEERENMTLLHKLVSAALKHPKFFLSAWRRCSMDVTHEDFRVEEDGETILYRLVYAAQKGETAPLLEVWQTRPDLFSTQDLRFKLPYSHLPSVIQMLQISSMASTSMLNLLWDISRHSEILPKMRFQIKYQQPVAYGEWLQQNNSADSELKARLFNLITAKKALLDLMREYEENEKLLSESDTKKLCGYAHQAAAAGYLNAYFVLGCYFSKMSFLQDAFNAFSKVPTSAFCDDKLSIIIETAYALAIDRDSSHLQRDIYLGLAMRYALQIDSDETRYQIIQKLAYAYITEGKESGMGERNLVKKDLLQAMHKGTDHKWCFKQFDRLKKSRLRKMECARLVAENGKLVGQVALLESVISKLCEVKPKQDENPETSIGANESLVFSDVVTQDAPTISTNSLESEQTRKRQRLKGKEKTN